MYVPAFASFKPGSWSDPLEVVFNTPKERDLPLITIDALITDFFGNALRSGATIFPTDTATVGAVATFVLRIFTLGTISPVIGFDEFDEYSTTPVAITFGAGEMSTGIEVEVLGEGVGVVTGVGVVEATGVGVVTGAGTRTGVGVVAGLGLSEAAGFGTTTGAGAGGT